MCDREIICEELLISLLQPDEILEHSTYEPLRHEPVHAVFFFLVNRVEHQKRTQTTAELPFGFVFGVQLGLRQTQALNNI